MKLESLGVIVLFGIVGVLGVDVFGVEVFFL